MYGVAMTEMVPITKLHEWADNPRTISQESMDALKRSLLADPEFMQLRPILALPDGTVYAGNMRLAAARALGWPEVPCIIEDIPVELMHRRAVTDNNEYGEWEAQSLSDLLASISVPALDLGFHEGELERLMKSLSSSQDTTPSPSLADRFIVPPFTVLDARQGYWQDRKRQWIGIGIESEVGRGENLSGFSDTARNAGGRRLTYVAGNREDLDEVSAKILETGAGTSIFDPVLCELAYRWFSPPSGRVLDPFAGGSVRGLVASILGRTYTGIDLSAIQVEANRQQAQALNVDPVWVVGDGLDAASLAPGEYDFILTCPPYGDLERYSDDTRDLSTMKYADFVTAYASIIAASVAMLNDDSFACVVVGDFRDKNGLYRNFPGDTIEVFERAGMQLYNEAILVTAIGSLSIRAGKQFSASRKLGKAHQNVYVFVKGDPVKATQKCGEVEVTLPDELFGETLD